MRQRQQQFPGVWLDGRYIRFMAGGDGTGDGTGGDSGGSDDGDTGGSPQDPPSTGGSTSSGDSGKTSSAITFSDTRALGRRLAQEREKALLQTAQDSGFSTVAEFQDHLKAIKEKREKDQGEAATLRQKMAEAEQKLHEATSRTQRLALRHAVEIEATKLGFQDPEDAFGLATFGDVSFDDDGNPDRGAITTKLKDLAKTKSYLLTEDARSKQNGGSGNSGGANTGGRNNGTGGGSNPSRVGATSVTAGSISDERRRELAKRFPFAGFDKR